MERIESKIEQLESEMSEMEHEQLYLEKAREQNKINQIKDKDKEKFGELIGESLVYMAEDLGPTGKIYQIS